MLNKIGHKHFFCFRKKNNFSLKVCPILLLKQAALLSNKIKHFKTLTICLIFRFFLNKMPSPLFTGIFRQN